MRDGFTNSTKASLALRVAHHCSNPQCRRITTGAHSDPAKATNVGVAAHITAASSGGPRYNENLNADERRCIENGIWLCQTCAKLVDNDAGAYTVGLLSSWKQLAELTASRRVDGSLALPGELAQIGENELLPGDEMEVVVMARLIGELDRVDIGILVFMASCYTTAVGRPEGTEHDISCCMPIIDNDDDVGYSMVEKEMVFSELQAHLALAAYS